MDTQPNPYETIEFEEDVDNPKVNTPSTTPSGTPSMYAKIATEPRPAPPARMEFNTTDNYAYYVPFFTVNTNDDRPKKFIKMLDESSTKMLEINAATKPFLFTDVAGTVPNNEMIIFITNVGCHHSRISGALFDGVTSEYVIESIYQHWDQLTQNARDWYSHFLYQLDLSISQLAAEIKSLTKLGKSKDDAEKILSSTHTTSDASRIKSIYLKSYEYTTGKPKIPIFAKLLERKGLESFYNAYVQGFTTRNKDTYRKNLKITHFNVDMGNYIRSKLEHIKFGSVDEYPIDIDKETRYINLADDQKNIIGYDKSNQQYYIQEGGNKRNKMRGGDKVKKFLDKKNASDMLEMKSDCSTTFIPDAECDIVINECLLNDDKDSLEKCFTNLKVQNAFHDIAVNDIKKMHPLMALRMLQKFKFSTYKVHDDTAGTKILKVESVSHWLKNYLAKNHTANELKTILEDSVQNQKILQYLDWVVQYVNANPAILNKSYSGKSDDMTGKMPVPPCAKILQLDYPVVKPPAIANLSCIYALRGLIQNRVKTAPFYRTSYGMGTPYGSMFTPGVPMLRPPIAMHMGGGNNTCHIIAAQMKEQGANVISYWLESLLKGFEARNKKLNDTDKKYLKTRITNYKEVQDELIKTLCYMEQYIGVVDSEKDYSDETVSKKKVEQLSARYDKLFNKSQVMEGDLVSALIKLIETMDGDGGDKSYTPL